MIQELIFTSAPRGLQIGKSGFCTVASTPGMAENVARLLESLSGYRHIFPAGSSGPQTNPVAYSHFITRVGGRPLHIVSRVADAGLDYSGRSNKIAHHLALDANRLPAGGPIGILRTPSLFLETWNRPPERLPPKTLADGENPPRPCKAWEQVTGDAGWGASLAEAYLSRRPAYLIVDPQTPALDLIAESLALLPTTEQWRVTFSSYFTNLPANVECHWRCVQSGSTEEAVARRNPQNLVLDLTQKLGPTTSYHALAARNGSAISSHLSLARTVDSENDLLLEFDTDAAPESTTKRSPTPLPPRITAHENKASKASMARGSYHGADHEGQDFERRSIYPGFIAAAIIMVLLLVGGSMVLLNSEKVTAWISANGNLLAENDTKNTRKESELNSKEPGTGKKAEESKASESKAEESIAEEPKTEAPITEAPKTEEPKTEEPKTEEPDREFLSPDNFNVDLMRIPEFTDEDFGNGTAHPILTINTTIDSSKLMYLDLNAIPETQSTPNNEVKVERVNDALEWNVSDGDHLVGKFTFKQHDDKTGKWNVCFEFVPLSTAADKSTYSNFLERRFRISDSEKKTLAVFALKSIQPKQEFVKAKLDSEPISLAFAASTDKIRFDTVTLKALILESTNSKYPRVAISTQSTEEKVIIEVLCDESDYNSADIPHIVLHLENQKGTSGDAGWQVNSDFVLFEDSATIARNSVNTGKHSREFKSDHADELTRLLDKRRKLKLEAADPENSNEFVKSMKDKNDFAELTKFFDAIEKQAKFDSINLEIQLLHERHHLEQEESKKKDQQSQIKIDATNGNISLLGARIENRKNIPEKLKDSKVSLKKAIESLVIPIFVANQEATVESDVILLVFKKKAVVSEEIKNAIAPFWYKALFNKYVNQTSD